MAIAIQNDDLRVYETKKRKDAEHCILTAATLIAPLIINNNNISAGIPIYYY